MAVPSLQNEDDQDRDDQRINDRRFDEHQTEHEVRADAARRLRLAGDPLRGSGDGDAHADGGRCGGQTDADRGGDGLAAGDGVGGLLGGGRVRIGAVRRGGECRHGAEDADEQGEQRHGDDLFGRFFHDLSLRYRHLVFGAFFSDGADTSP